MFKELIDRTLTSAGGETESSYGDKLCLISIDLINKITLWLAVHSNGK
jgi:hypothetical protein